VAGTTPASGGYVPGSSDNALIRARRQDDVAVERRSGLLQ
jgi:hypothetical protein